MIFVKIYISFYWERSKYVKCIQEMPWDVKNEPHTGKAEEYESGAEKKEKPGKKRKFWFQFWK